MKNGCLNGNAWALKDCLLFSLQNGFFETLLEKKDFRPFFIPFAIAAKSNWYIWLMMSEWHHYLRTNCFEQKRTASFLELCGLLFVAIFCAWFVEINFFIILVLCCFPSFSPVQCTMHFDRSFRHWNGQRRIAPLPPSSTCKLIGGQIRVWPQPSPPPWLGPQTTLLLALFLLSILR